MTVHDGPDHDSVRRRHDHRDAPRQGLSAAAAFSTVAAALLAQAPTAIPAAPDPPQASSQLAALRRRWASLIRRVYEVDPLLCPRCRSLMGVVSFITEPGLIRHILDQLAHGTEEGRVPPPSQPVQTPA